MNSLITRANYCACCGCAFTREQQLANLPLVTVNNAPSRGENESSDDKKKAPLAIAHCSSCGHIQLTEIVNPAFLYKKFTYTTSTTVGMKNFFSRVKEIANKVFDSRQRRLVIDIGANDGTFLELFGDLFKVRVAVEPSLLASDICRQKRLNVISEFFDHSTAREIVAKFGQADFVFCANTLANIADVNSFLSALRQVLTNGGIFCVATQDGHRVIRDTLIDTVYHEHVHYFTEHSICCLLERFGFRVIFSEYNLQKGAGLLLFFEKLPETAGTYVRHGKHSGRSSITAAEFDAFIERNLLISSAVERCIVDVGPDKILGFGASVGTTTLVAISNLGGSLSGFLDDKQVSTRFPWLGEWLPVYRASDYRPAVGKTLIINFAYRYSHLIRANNARLLSMPGVIFRDFSEFISK
jgi:SAM-dependent methyltransferase